MIEQHNDMIDVKTQKLKIILKIKLTYDI